MLFIPQNIAQVKSLSYKFSEMRGNLAETLQTLIHLTLCYFKPFFKASAKPMLSHSIPYPR